MLILNTLRIHTPYYVFMFGTKAEIFEHLQKKSSQSIGLLGNNVYCENKRVGEIIPIGVWFTDHFMPQYSHTNGNCIILLEDYKRVGNWSSDHFYFDEIYLKQTGS